MWFVYALGAAACFGIRGIFYQWTARRLLDRNLLLLGVYICGASITVMLNLFVGQSWNQSVWLGILMGTFSFAANAALYKGYAVGKASVIALLSGCPPLVVVVLAYLLWGESLNGMQLAGFFLIVFGLIVIRYGQDLQQGRLQGWQWGVLTMFFFGLTDISSKQDTLLDASILPVLTVMYATGSLWFGVFYLMQQGRAYKAKKKRIEERDNSIGESGKEASRWTPRRTFLWGMVIGISNIAGMILLLPAFRDGITGVVSAIGSMSVVMVLLYAWLYLKEKMKRQEMGGIAVALIGMLILRIAG